MEPETTPELPHITRERISREMAFPVGYEFLRDHFGTAIACQQSWLRFRVHPTRSASGFAQVLRTGECYPILRVERCHQAHINDHSPAHWAFTVFPVANHQRSAARTAFMAGALADLQNFVAHCPRYWNYYNSCIALFDPVHGFCRAEQLHPFGNAPKADRPSPSPKRPERTDEN